MDFGERRRRGMVGYDERTETWFLRSRESQRLMLTRQSLHHLVQMYNEIHQGRPLVLLERAALERIEEARAEQAGLLRELRLRLHRREPGWSRSLGRILAPLLRRGRSPRP